MMMRLAILLVPLLYVDDNAFTTTAAAFVSSPPLMSSSSSPSPQRVSSSATNRLYNDLWGGEPPPEKDGQVKEMSKALPFAPRPKLLDGTLAGDVGFEYVSDKPTTTTAAKSRMNES
jgi:hypothetical protein